jgi:hypothetical protein
MADQDAKDSNLSNSAKDKVLKRAGAGNQWKSAESRFDDDAPNQEKIVGSGNSKGTRQNASGANEIKSAVGTVDQPVDAANPDSNKTGSNISSAQRDTARTGAILPVNDGMYGIDTPGHTTSSVADTRISHQHLTPSAHPNPSRADNAPELPGGSPNPAPNSEKASIHQIPALDAHSSASGTASNALPVQADAHCRSREQNLAMPSIPPLAISLDPHHPDHHETPEFVRQQREQLAAAREEYRKEISNQQAAKAKSNLQSQSQPQSQSQTSTPPPGNRSESSITDRSAKSGAAGKTMLPQTESPNPGKATLSGSSPNEAGKRSAADAGTSEHPRIGPSPSSEGSSHGTIHGAGREASLKADERKQSISEKSPVADSRAGNTPVKANPSDPNRADHKQDPGGSDIAKGHRDSGKDPSSNAPKGHQGSGKELGGAINANLGDGNKVQGGSSAPPNPSAASHADSGKAQGGSDIATGHHDGKHSEPPKGVDTRHGDPSDSPKSTRMPGRTESIDIGGHAHSDPGGKSQIPRAPSHSEIDSLTDAKGQAHGSHHGDRADASQGQLNDGHRSPRGDSSAGRGPLFIPAVITDRDGNRIRKDDPSRKEIAPGAKPEPGKSIVNSVANSVANAIADGLSNIKDKLILPAPSDKTTPPARITHRITPSEKIIPSDKITPSDKTTPSGKSGPTDTTNLSDKTTITPGRIPPDKTATAANTLEPGKTDPRVEAAGRLIKGQTYKPDIGVVINRHFGGETDGTKTHLIYHGRGKLSDSDGTAAGARPSGGLKAALKQIFGDNRAPDNRFVSLPGFKTLKIDSSPTRILTPKAASGSGPKTTAYAPRTKGGDTIRLRASTSGRSSTASFGTASGGSGTVFGNSGTASSRTAKVSNRPGGETNDNLVVKRGLISGDLETRRKVARESVYLRNQKGDKIETLSLREQLKQLRAIEDAAKRGFGESKSLGATETPRSAGEEHDERYLYYVQAGDTMRSIFQEQLPDEVGNRQLFDFFIAMNEQNVRLNSALAADGMTLILKPGTVIKLPTPRQISNLNK